MTRDEFLNKCNSKELKVIFSEIDLMLLAENNPCAIFTITVKPILVDDVIKELKNRGFFILKNNKVFSDIRFSAMEFNK